VKRHVLPAVAILLLVGGIGASLAEKNYASSAAILVAQKAQGMQVESTQPDRLVAVAQNWQWVSLGLGLLAILVCSIAIWRGDLLRWMVLLPLMFVYLVLQVLLV
jgi:hypothetical protein